MKTFLCFLLAALLLCGCQQTNQQAALTQPSAVPTKPSQAPADTVPSPSEPEPTSPPDSLLEVLDAMTLEERVGQLFLARCPESNALQDIARYHLGGYILFARDFENENPDSLRSEITSWQAAAKIPMLLAVDEEGGTVTRISQFPAFREKKFYSPRYLYAQGGLERIWETAQEKCELLQSLGLNVNIGPVCDITTDKHAFMYNRSLGQSPKITGQFVQGIVDVMHRNRIGGILKHFPGYGNNTDTHTGIAVDNRSLADLESIDLVPFRMGIESGCDAIMVSHVYINAIDPDTPATLSPAVHQYLREAMGFEGVIVTDDLVMEAITDIYGVGESAVLAVQAGNDLLCASDYAIQYEAVLQAVKNGRISEEHLNASVLRILRWKQELGLIQ